VTLRYPRWVRTALIAACLLLIAAPASARENTGAGVSLGLGVAGFSPSPGPSFLMDLPSLEVAVGLKDPSRMQARFRWHGLKTIWAAALEQQLEVQIDAMLLMTPCDCAVGNHMIRPVLGPSVGFLLQAIPSVDTTQVGAVVGGRFGAEYVGPARRIGLTVAAEPFFLVQGGSAGPSRTGSRFGGGAQIVIALTGYQTP
jgi:hypothetical protein